MAKSNMDVVLDCAEPQRLEAFWRAALGYRSLRSFEHIVVLVANNDVSPPLILQRVPEAKNGKNRMHIDIVRDDVEADVARLEVLGARRLHDGLRRMGGVRWVTMADPDDNEFCVSTGVEW
jgi:predicted enzyme related to lactoylglutathione lyase